jgi:hypothetical protein
MADKPSFTKPELIEFGPLSEIVQQADGHPPPSPTGWEGRTPVCLGGEGPGKPDCCPDAHQPCGSDHGS